MKVVDPMLVPQGGSAQTLRPYSVDHWPGRLLVMGLWAASCDAQEPYLIMGRLNY